MATIILYEPTVRPNWFGNNSVYDMICDYAIKHPAVQAHPNLVQELRDSLWYKNLELHRSSHEEIQAFYSAVQDLVDFLATPEVGQRMGEYRDGYLYRVGLLRDLLKHYLAEKTHLET